MDLKQGTQLQGGKYLINSVLGRGGFGITYLATHTSLDRKVAIKEFFMKDRCDRTHISNNVSYGSASQRDMSERFKGKFKKEAEMIAKFENKYIVNIYDIFEENDTVYYVMEYVSEGSLNLSGAISEESALRYICQVADALDYVHSQSVNHLDVKPSNILKRVNGDIVLIDFGISKHYDEKQRQTSTTPVGVSAGYAPIEQYKHGGVSSFSPATDIYSLGATLYKFVTGNIPPDAQDIVDDGLPSLPSAISPTTKKAIEASMQVRRKDRPQSIAEFLKILNVYGVSQGTIVPKTHSAQPDSRKGEQIHKLFQDLKAAKEKPRNRVVEEEDMTPTSPLKPKYAAEDLIPTKRGNKYGYLAPSGEVVIPFVYEDANSFCDGLAGVKRDGKWGFIDSTGKCIIDHKYRSVSDFSEGLAWGTYYGIYSESRVTSTSISELKCINTKGSELFSIMVYSASTFKDGVAVVETGAWNLKRFNLINKNGDFVTSRHYSIIYPFVNRIARVAEIISTKQEMVFGTMMDVHTYKYGYINITGKEITPVKYIKAEDFSGSYAKVEAKNLFGRVKRGRINISGKEFWD